MRKFACIFFLAMSACASGQRPVKQLEANEVMIGVNGNALGPRGDAETALWVRYAPWKYVDLTGGAVVSLPFFESIAGGLLGELRVHLPIGSKARIVLVGSEELINRQFSDDSRGWTHRVSASPLIAYDGDDFTPYFGPKLVFWSKFDRAPSGVSSDWDFRPSGSGMYTFGGVGGLESTVEDGPVIGVAAEGGLLINARSGVSEGLAAAVSIYLAY